MDRIIFFTVLLLAYIAANLFVKYDNKRIEAEVSSRNDLTTPTRREIIKTI
jgi:hypothetical protein